MKPQHGFTLLEVLVAVAVLALTLGMFVSGGSRYADGARYLHDKTLGLWVARNKMVEYQLAENWPEEGESDGRVDMGERKWEWQTEVSESPDPRVRRIEVRVFRTDPDNPRSVEDDPIATLTGFITPRDDQTTTQAPDPSLLNNGLPGQL